MSASNEKGYWLVTAVVTNPDGFQGYTAKAGPTIAKAGGKVLAGATSSRLSKVTLPAARS